MSAEHNTLTRAEIEKEILKEIYMANKFHTFIRPEGKVQGSVDAPVIVRVSMYVLNIDVDTVKQVNKKFNGVTSHQIMEGYDENISKKNLS